MMLQTYKANLDAIGVTNPGLKEKLLLLQENSRFEVYQGDTPHALNIFDHESGRLLYENPEKEFSESIKDLQKYREYGYLYMFGIGNGFLIHDAIEKFSFLQMVVIEPCIELLFIAFHFSDFSTALRRGRLIVLEESDLTFSVAISIFGHSNAPVYLKMFELQVPLDYYLEVHEESYKKAFNLMLKAAEQVAVVLGNDIKDSIIGVRHHIANLPKMLSGPTVREFFTQKQSKIAVVVSTGPSLYKQLETLKEIQEYVTIISVDASFPILTNAGIKPDFCTSMERVIESAKFFEDTPAEKHQGVTFVCVSLQHPDLFKAIKGDIVIGMRPFGYNHYFGLDDYGYICYGMSAANMAHELAAQMKFEKCVLIGQDLAFGKDGLSHSKGHVYGEDQLQDGKDKIDKAEYDLVDVEAYGGEGSVKTIYVWNAFRNYFEQTILDTSGYIETINCTEGGSRIAGATEMPFEQIAKMVKEEGVKKGKIVLEKPTEKVIKANLSIAKKKITVLLKEGKQLQKAVEKQFVSLHKKSQKLENMTKEEALEIWSDQEIILLLDSIEETRKKLYGSEVFNSFYYEVIKPYIVHLEMDLAKVKSMYVDNPQTNKEKAVKWILGNRYLFFSIAGGISYVNDAINENNPFKAG
ncbi:MAG TPA: 6-hydroxymethylpterin diphosphokinase MptE-like protein [Sulfuricurvum sp.]|nr:6-hydroxymethylpterin diphosphokinase MptE-like protein [Sulfuricurvum sp.]